MPLLGPLAWGEFGCELGWCFGDDELGAAAVGFVDDVEEAFDVCEGVALFVF